MASSGIPGVTWDAVTYVQRALLQDKTNAEAGAMFSRMIQESLKSWFTQVRRAVFVCCLGLCPCGEILLYSFIETSVLSYCVPSVYYL